MTAGEPGLGDLFGMLGKLPNPITAMTQSVEQFRRAVDDLLHAVETFTEAMDNLNTMVGRVNRLLDDVEEPIRLVVPQFTATVRAADSLVRQLTEPANRLPEQMTEFADLLADVSARLGPFGQLLDSATGLLRHHPLRGLLGLGVIGEQLRGDERGGDDVPGKA